jgi:hypothetical protein
VSSLGKSSLSEAEMIARAETIANGGTVKATPVTMTSNLWSSLGTIYSKVLPSEIQSSDPLVKSWANTQVMDEIYSTTPSGQLYNLFSSSDEATLYFKMWQARGKITSLDKLKEYDSSPLTSGSYKGNISQAQYEDILRYFASPDKTAYLAAHPELKTNPRDDYLAKNPDANAQLALWGQADVTSKAALNKLVTLAKTLDIPQSAVKALPPTTAVSAYGDWLDAVDKYGESSAQAKNIVFTSKPLQDWFTSKSKALPTGNPESIAIQIKYEKEYAAYAVFDKQSKDFEDPTSKTYIANVNMRATQQALTQAAQDKYLAANPLFRDQMWYADGLDMKMPANIANLYVGYKKSLDKTMFRQQHRDFDDWYVQHNYVNPLNWVNPVKK